MVDPPGGPVYDPQDLEGLLVARQNAGDVDGMVALYERDAILDCGEGRILRGKKAIREYFHELTAGGKKFEIGAQRPALICGGLALTATRLPDGDVTTEIARRQDDGSWLWVIDRFNVT